MDHKANLRIVGKINETRF